ncbi:hypothetical protein GQE99_14390 [Maritimibacter sp. DP07]|uniref:Uncharacterized protein n=1 Tax=Maritimibacter harenae TaxID=2606218 RepID=A0A845M6N4_9RHOB|nr:hypothetical protein [Maritimibacter harenae]MZR14208.1 hypothetical protein [Maritimibacter harenae]
MTEIRLPISITYETEGPVAIGDVIVALQAAEAIADDAVALLPSLIDGLQINGSSLNVRSLEQGSLREAFFLALLFTYQGALEEEVPPMIEDLFNITVSDQYDTLATLVFLIVIFYGAGLAIDVVKKAFSDSLPRAKFEELVKLLAAETGKPAADIRDIIEAKFQKPAAAKRVVRNAGKFFLPSHKGSNAPLKVDRDTISSEVVRQIPFDGSTDKENDFDRYKPYEAVELEIHAQDKDKSSTGWAAVARGISDKRLKVRVVEPVHPADIWQKDVVTADIVLVLKLTSDGYVPAEIQVTRLVEPGEN